MDLGSFLDIFLNDLFPELADRPIHFAGESFGGKYVPVYTSMSRRVYESIVLVDPFLDPARHALGIYDHFCPAPGEPREPDNEGDRPSRYFNETVCRAMEDAYDHCSGLGDLCRMTYDPSICFIAREDCWNDFFAHLIDQAVPGGRDPYDDRHKCVKPPLCGGLGSSFPLFWLHS
jgi:carboxypeptidase C (cathepsin A)